MRLNQSEFQKTIIDKLIKSKYEEKSHSLYLLEDDCASEWQQVLNHRQWESLQKLFLWKCRIDVENIRIIAQIGWPKLIKLSLQANNIGSGGAKIISKCALSAIRQIELSSCNIGREGTIHLLKNAWVNLQSLYLKNNKIGLDGYFSVRLQHSHSFYLILVAQNNAIGMINMFASICQNTICKRIVCTERGFMKNSAIRDDLAIIFASKNKKQ